MKIIDCNDKHIFNGLENSSIDNKFKIGALHAKGNISTLINV